MTDLFALASSMAAETADGSLPPVEKWNPDYCGEIDIVIRRDGVWVHEGSPIGRAKLVRLFSTVLRREGDEYFLVTPVEKLQLTVEDVPFLAVGMEVEGQGADRTLRFRTNVGDEVVAGPGNPLEFHKSREDEGALIPYVEVRAGLKARLTRALYYDFVHYLEGDPPFLRSKGAVFRYEQSVAPRP